MKKRPDKRIIVVAATLGGAAALGLLVWLTVLVLVNLKGSGNEVQAPKIEIKSHVTANNERQVKTRFDQAVIMLHAREYEHAVTALHSVLKIAPRLPEAHVNMGFALLGMKRYKGAKDFFESAIELRPQQVNAYYGLASALEGLGDIERAIGAMRSFVHLAKPDDPYIRKANSLLREWENKLKSKHKENPGDAGQTDTKEDFPTEKKKRETIPGNENHPS